MEYKEISVGCSQTFAFEITNKYSPASVHYFSDSVLLDGMINI